MFKAARTSLGQLNCSVTGAGCKWQPSTNQVDRRFRHSLLKLSNSRRGAAFASTPALVGTHHSGALLQSSHESLLQCQQLGFYRTGKVSRSNEQETQTQKNSPQLMNLPWVVWPKLWYSVTNWISYNFLLHGYRGQDFDMASFKKGAVQALVYVSHELSRGNFEALEDVVTSPSLDEIKKNFAQFSLKQRLDLAVVKEDIFFSFPYHIQVLLQNKGTKNERVFVEITMCYHIFRDFQDHVNSKSAAGSPGSLKLVYDEIDRISIANYGFIREFTKGVVDDWMVSRLNHFKPGEMLQQQQ